MVNGWNSVNFERQRVYEDVPALVTREIKPGLVTGRPISTIKEKYVQA